MDSSREIVGEALAVEVASRLEAGNILAYHHRDYCGVGLRYAEEVFIYGEVNDSELPSESEITNWQVEHERERKLFTSRDEFVKWLAQQTDESLSGKHLADVSLHNNQRLTISRLREFTRHEETKPLWKIW